MASGQRGILAGATLLLGFLVVIGPVSKGSAGGPYQGARITCAFSATLAIEVKGNGFPSKSPTKLVFRSVGRVLASVSTTTSASGSFSAFLALPSPVVSGEVTATATATDGTLVRASCSVALSP